MKRKPPIHLGGSIVPYSHRFEVPTKLVKLIKMSLNETYSKVRIGKYLSDNFPIANGLHEGDVSWPLIYNFALKYAIRKVHENKVEQKLNGTHQLLGYADDVNLLGDNMGTIKKEVKLSSCLIN
jgi:hypothetical protein